MILFGGEVGYTFIRRNLINRRCPNTLCLILTSIFAAVNVSEPNSDSSVFVETQDLRYRIFIIGQKINRYRFLQIIIMLT